MSHNKITRAAAALRNRTVRGVSSERRKGAGGDYKSWTVPQLRDALGAAGIVIPNGVKMKKDDCIAILKANQGKEGSSTSDKTGHHDSGAPAESMRTEEVQVHDVEAISSPLIDIALFNSTVTDLAKSVKSLIEKLPQQQAAIVSSDGSTTDALMGRRSENDGYGHQQAMEGSYTLDTATRSVGNLPRIDEPIYQHTRPRGQG